MYEFTDGLIWPREHSRGAVIGLLDFHWIYLSRLVYRVILRAYFPGLLYRLTLQVDSVD